jgi:hypothetical protein
LSPSRSSRATTSCSESCRTLTYPRPRSRLVLVARSRGTWATSGWTTGWWAWIPSPPTWTKRSEVHRVMRAWTRRRRTVERGEQPVNSAALRVATG